MRRISPTRIVDRLRENEREREWGILSFAILPVHLSLTRLFRMKGGL